MISRKTTISAAALLLASAGAAAAFPATATTDLNVRSGPGTGYSVIDQLQAGDTVEIVARRGSWYRTAEGGWASAAFLDAEGGQAAYYSEGGYGPVAFYYDDNPYYWDDAGFYFYIDGGRRHRVGRNWFRDRDSDDLRWASSYHRSHFERRFGGNARNWDDDDDDDGRGFGGGGNVSAGASMDDDDDEGQRFGSGGPNASAGAAIEAEGQQPLRTDRASASGPPLAGAKAQGGGQGQRMRGQGGGGQGSGGGGPVLPPRQDSIPGGGY